MASPAVAVAVDDLAPRNDLLTNAPVSVGVFTDGEPDDGVAILTLAQRGIAIDFVVVGEGDSRIKYERLCEYWRVLHQQYPKLFAAEPNVLRGLSSKKPFHADGQEILNSEALLARAAALPEAQDKWQVCADIGRMLEVYITDKATPYLVALKPMRELLAIWGGLDATLRAKTTIAYYGSFNFRSLMSRTQPATSHDLLTAMIHGFGRVIVFESFAAFGNDNSMSRTSMPLTFAAMDKALPSSPFLACMFRLIRTWNEHSLAECEANLRWHDTQPQSDKAARARSAKIIAHLQASDFGHMVLADSGLALVLGNAEFATYARPVRISFDLATGYMKTRDDDTSNVWVYEKLPPYATLDAATAKILTS